MVGLDKDDSDKTFAFRFTGAAGGGVGLGLAAQCAVRGNAEVSIASSMDLLDLGVGWALEPLTLGEKEELEDRCWLCSCMSILVPVSFRVCCLHPHENVFSAWHDQRLLCTVLTMLTYPTY